MNPSQLWIAGFFWACLLLVAYAYFGYPLLIWGLARRFGRCSPPPPDDAHLPSVSVLIAAYNEAAVIRERLENALGLDYPPEKLEIVVASDGSTDDTAAIVRRYAKRGVRLLDYAHRRGKAAVLNTAFKEVKGAIVLLSDANTHVEPQALRRLVRWFNDPRVGVVCGRLVLTDPHTGRNIDSWYWKYETFIKRAEGRLGALLGANGAIYAIRRDVYTPIPNNTILDDLVIPLLARLRTGCALVYDALAVAHEETAPDVGAEFRRRSRIGAGGFQSMGLLWRLLNPLQGWVTFTYSSHKILRWLGPFFLIGLVVANLLLWEVPFFQVTLLGQMGFYLISGLGAYVPPASSRWGRFGRPLKPLRLMTMFTGMNMALMLGFIRWARGSQSATWSRTARLAELRRADGREMRDESLPPPSRVPQPSANGTVP